MDGLRELLAAADELVIRVAADLEVERIRQSARDKAAQLRRQQAECEEWGLTEHAAALAELAARIEQAISTKPDEATLPGLDSDFDEPVPMEPTDRAVVAMGDGSLPVLDTPKKPPKVEPSYSREEFNEQKRIFEERFARFYDDRDVPAHVRLARLKGLTAALRGLFVMADGLGWDPFELQQVRGELETSVKVEYPNDYIVALGKKEQGDAEDFLILADAYFRLETVYDAVDLLHGGRALDPAQRLQLVSHCAAAESLLHRSLNKLGARDDGQLDLHKILEEMAEDLRTHIPWWHKDKKAKDLIAAADTLADDLAAIREQLGHKDEREDALIALREAVCAGQNLEEAALACLVAGIPPSNPELRDLLLDFVALFRESKEKKFKPLVKELDKEATRRANNGDQEDVEDDAPVDATVMERVKELLPHTRGKVGIFIGGKPLEERRKEVESLLEFRELMWPYTESSDKPKAILATALKADILLYTRFNRKAAKELVDECVEKGAEVIRLPAGLGIARIVNDMSDHYARQEASAQP